MAGGLMVEEAEEYLDHGKRIKQLEERLNEFLFEDWVNLFDRIGRIERLLAEHRMRIISYRCFSVLQTTALAVQGHSAEIRKINTALAAVSREMSWFLGAIREAIEPLTVYDEWLAKLRARLVDAGFPSLIEAGAEFPPLQESL